MDGVALADGDRVLFSNVTTGSDNIYIWNVGTTSWSEDPLNPVTDGDAVFVREGSEADALYFFNGTSWVKYADDNSYAELAYLRAFMGKDAAGNEMPSYTSTNVVANSDSLETAVGKLDAEVGYVDSFIGKSVGNEMPTYSSTEVVTQNGSLESAIGELDAAMGDGTITNAGGNYALASDMTWGGGANDVTEALDQLNAAIGDRSYTSDFNVSDGQSVAASVDALDVAIGSRQFTNDYVVTDGQSVTASLDAIDSAFGNRQYSENNVVVDGQTVTASIEALDVAVGTFQDLTLVVSGTNIAATNYVMDSIPVTEATQVKWMVQVRENGTPAKRRSMEVHALTDGTSVDHAEYAVLKLGANIAGFDINVDINGGNIRILVTATNNIDFVVKRISYSAF